MEKENNIVRKKLMVKMQKNSEEANQTNINKAGRPKVNGLMPITIIWSQMTQWSDMTLSNNKQKISKLYLLSQYKKKKQKHKIFIKTQYHNKFSDLASTLLPLPLVSALPL
jgi:hypothetical protein